MKMPLKIIQKTSKIRLSLIYFSAQSKSNHALPLCRLRIFTLLSDDWSDRIKRAAKFSHLNILAKYSPVSITNVCNLQRYQEPWSDCNSYYFTQRNNFILSLIHYIIWVIEYVRLLDRLEYSSKPSKRENDRK